MISLGRSWLPITAALCLCAPGCDGPAPTADAGPSDGGPRRDAPIFYDGSVLCDADEDCDDGVSCTNDSCASDGTCRNSVQASLCDDGVFCNGVERCDPRVGCIAPNMRETCNDGDVCTIDRCDEEADVCRHFPRDLDEDGDPDWFCAGGGDCDDTNPSVSSLVNEVCDDFIDNDCDAIVDEPACGRPAWDLCDDPLDVSAGGFFELDTTGATSDYSLGCPGTGRLDLVASFTLAEARSVSIEGEGDFFTVALSLRTECASQASEITCESGFPGRVQRRSLEPGTYYVLVAASTPGEIGLSVRFAAPAPPALNDGCASPTDVSAGGTYTESFVEVGDDLTTSCGFGSAPDLVYTFTTEAESNVAIVAQSATGESMFWSVRSSCAETSSDLRCVYGGPASGTIHQLPAGTYFLVVEGPTYVDVDLRLTVEILPPTPPPPGDRCDSPLALTLGVASTGTFLDKQDDIEVSCGFRYRDAVHTFTLAEASDVLVQLDGGGFANMSVRPTCTEGATQLRCASGDPASARLRDVAAGTYYVIVESWRGGGYTLRVDATPPTVTVDVTGNDTCATAAVIPAEGGLFRGDTSGLVGNYATSTCGGGAGSNDAVFALTLTATRRVTVSTDGSAFDTVLFMYRDACTAGSELYCDDDGAGSGGASLITRVLDPGTHYIVVDGYGTSSRGEYLLEVMLTDP